MAVVSACVLLASLSVASAQSPVERVQSLLAWSEHKDTALPVEQKKSILHEIVAKKLGSLGGTFQKFAAKHNVNISNKTNSMLERSKREAALEQEKKSAAAVSELASLKKEYQATKIHKSELMQKATKLTEEIELAQIKQQIATAGSKMQHTKKRMHELGYEETAQKKALTFQKLYSIKYGASGLRYNNNPERPGVHKENDGGAYSKYGWHMDAEWHGDQKCEEYSKCPDVFMKGSHPDGSSTCNDDPMYYDCDGDSCEYYEEHPEECGKHDATCSGEDTGHWASQSQNPCSSQGKKMQGCCVCQHHHDSFDGEPVAGSTWDFSESPTEYHDAGCGTWETCEERLQKESWYDRLGHKCEDYEDEPEKCDDALTQQYMGHDANECCPKELDRPCGHKPCPVGTFGVSAGRRSETVDTSCSKCPAGKYNPKENKHTNDACIDCVAGKYGEDDGASSAAECTDCAKGKYSTSVGASESDACADCAAGKYSDTSGANADKYCTNCVAGKYNENEGSDDKDDCENCAAGTFSGSAGADEESDCADCSAGEYCAIGGCSSCAECAQGKYSAATAATSEDTCTQCAAGKFDSSDGSTAAVGETDCGNCPAGKFSVSTGAEDDTTCGDCDAGKYSDAEALSSGDDCTDCPAGSFGSESGLASEQDCAACTAGTISTAGSTVCAKCGAGKYSATDGDAECTGCDANYFQANTGASACTECDQGDSSAAGSTSCETIACEGHLFNDEKGHTADETCAAGKFKCNDGSFVKANYEDDCMCDCAECEDEADVNSAACSSSSTTDSSTTTTEGPTSSTTTDAATSSETTTESATTEGETTTEAATTSDSTTSDSTTGDDTTSDDTTSDDTTSDDTTSESTTTTSDDVPFICDDGEEVPSSYKNDCMCDCADCEDEDDESCTSSSTTTSSGTPDPCGAGETGPAGSCQDCVAGTYKTGSGEHACSKCKAGLYSDAVKATAKSTCKACAAGTYSASAGAAAASSCQDCGAGKYSTSSAASSMDVCTDCVAGKYSAAAAAGSADSCTKCAAGTYSVMEGANADTSCTECPAGSASATAGATDDSTCVECLVNEYADSAGSSTCTACPSGKLSDTPGATAADACKEPCNAGYSGPLGGPCTACTAGSFKPSEVEGQYKQGELGHSEHECELCSVHTYQDAEGQTSCKSCPSNSESVGEGTDSKAGCLCSPGYESDDEGADGHADGHSCVACPKEEFKTPVGSGSCEACEGASHSDVASPKCQCNHGYSGPDGSGSGCASCPPGTYKDQTGNAPCVDCPTGKHGMTEAATSDEFCRETYKIKFGASLVSNHPSASGNQGSIWNYGASKDNEFMGGDKGADTGGTIRYGGNGAYGEWAIDEDSTNFDATDTWNGPTGGNPGGRTVYDESFGTWHDTHKVDAHHSANNLDEYLEE